MTKTVLIIGASSGIGEALAYRFHNESYRIGLAARRIDKLNAIKDNLDSLVAVEEMDITNSEASLSAFNSMVEKLGKIDLVIISSGTGFVNEDLDYTKEIETIQTNCSGFVVMATQAFKHFQEKGAGHLVGISSVLMHRGSAYAPAYSASKAFVSNYMEGLRMKALKSRLNIHVTDIRPGYVDTAMAEGDNMFWVSSTEKAADQIFNAIKKKKKRAYITKRWALIAAILTIVPDYLYKRF